MGYKKLEDRISEIIRQPVRILNGMVGKGYEARLDFEKLDWKDLTEYNFSGLEDVGLQFNKKTGQIVGVPSKSGDLKLLFQFKIEGQSEEAGYNEKQIDLIINPDPKSLWKNIESDKSDRYYKTDDLTVFTHFGDRYLLASSKRGRSHANTGSFREDDFAYSTLPNGWSLVVVADGAGSARLSRHGSSLACNQVILYFEEQEAIDSLHKFDSLVQQNTGERDNDSQNNLSHLVYNLLGKAALTVHQKLLQFAVAEKVELKDLSTTLIFTLFKKFEASYAFLSFGVGDCPIAVLNKDMTEVFLLNRLDVGEYGGGTRFITMPEIFQSEKLASRCGLKIVPDFSYLCMMSDGIYDAKFGVESSLSDIKNWRTFLADLQGKNDEGLIVGLDPDNKEIGQELSAWMDFWSAGNHDDRTLAIVF
jgi:hypothetical protein